MDDLFAFVIKMPTLHRLSVFRDDLVFCIYIYQRWVYKVDKRRANEFGWAVSPVLLILRPQMRFVKIANLSSIILSIKRITGVGLWVLSWWTLVDWIFCPKNTFKCKKVFAWHWCTFKSNEIGTAVMFIWNLAGGVSWGKSFAKSWLNEAHIFIFPYMERLANARHV